MWVILVLLTPIYCLFSFQTDPHQINIHQPIPNMLTHLYSYQNHHLEQYLLKIATNLNITQQHLIQQLTIHRTYLIRTLNQLGTKQSTLTSKSQPIQSSYFFIKPQIDHKLTNDTNSNIMSESNRPSGLIQLLMIVSLVILIVLFVLCVNRKIKLNKQVKNRTENSQDQSVKYILMKPKK